MPIILAPEQAPTLVGLLEDIPQAKLLVGAIESGSRYSVDAPIRGIAALGNCSGDEISFIVSSKFQQQLDQTNACAVILPAAIATEALQGGLPPYARVVCEQPYLLYALIAHWFELKRQPELGPGIHPSALVDPSATISDSAIIGAHVVIGADTIIEDQVHIQANCVIGARCQIGAQSRLHPNVTLYDQVRIGRRGIFHSGVVLGADGFGFAPNPAMAKGAWGKIAQLGGVQIGDDVEIGANTTVDRGALDDTVIGNGVKLDNQIMIAHNCQIGEHTAMAACVGVAGSTTIGARCIIGGAAMFSGHITITDDVQISGGTAITTDINVAGRYTGVLPAVEHTLWQRNAAVMGQLAQLRKRLRELERQISSIS